MKRGEALRTYFRKIPKKVWAILTASVILVAVCTVATVFAVRHHRLKQISVVPVETESVTETVTESDSQTEPATVSASESETESTTKTPPKKPVGTTKPVEKDEEETLPPAPPPQPPAAKHKKLLDVPYIYQVNKYPTGCESVSTVMVMRYFGMSITVENFIDNYLPKGRAPFRDETGERFGDDPRKVFLGSPYSKSGWGCYAPVIVTAANKCIDHKKFEVKNITGTAFDTLCKTYIDNEIPVIVWATTDMLPLRPHKKSHTWNIIGTSEEFTWKSPMHCLVLVGYDDNNYYFNDPQREKNYRYSKSSVLTAYSALGMQAVVIQPKKEEPTEPTTDESTEPSETEPTTESTQSTVSDSKNSENAKQ